jgi:hypothetical protein
MASPMGFVSSNGVVFVKIYKEYNKRKRAEAKRKGD